MNTKQQLLRYIIDNQQWFQVTHAEIFDDEATNRIFHVGKRITEKGKPVSLPALEWLLRDKPKLVEELERLKEVTPIDKATATLMRDELREEAKQRFIQELPNHATDDPKIYKALLKRLNDLESFDVPEELEKVVSFTDWSRHIIEEGNTLDSGLRFLEGTGSDTKVGDLLNFLAASNNFKSGAMAHIVRHQIACGRNVLFFSMEETSEQFLHRIGHGMTHMTPHGYNQQTPEEVAKLYSGLKLGHLDVISGRQIIVEELQDLINEIEEERGYKYDFIIIDYSAQVGSNRYNKNSQEHQLITEIFRQLKLIAINPINPKIIVTAIQSNRGGYGKKTPDLDNTASSMGGVHNADLMISLKYKPNPAAPERATPADEEPDDIKGYVKFVIRKKRTGTIKVDDWFIGKHLASGNVSFDSLPTYTEDMWNQLFDGIFDEPSSEESGI